MVTGERNGAPAPRGAGMGVLGQPDGPSGNWLSCLAGAASMDTGVEGNPCSHLLTSTLGQASGMRTDGGALHPHTV